jgi:hypothetical protein
MVPNDVPTNLTHMGVRRDPYRVIFLFGDVADLLHSTTIGGYGSRLKAGTTRGGNFAI